MSDRAQTMILKLAKEKAAVPAVILEALELIATGEASREESAAIAMGLRMARWDGVVAQPQKEG